MAELKACPFCGGEARRYKSDVFFISIVEEYKSRRADKIRRRYNEVNHIH